MPRATFADESDATSPRFCCYVNNFVLMLGRRGLHVNKRSGLHGSRSSACVSRSTKGSAVGPRLRAADRSAGRCWAASRRPCSALVSASRDSDIDGRAPARVRGRDQEPHSAGGVVPALVVVTAHSGLVRSQAGARPTEMKGVAAGVEQAGGCPAAPGAQELHRALSKLIRANPLRRRARCRPLPCRGCRPAPGRSVRRGSAARCSGCRSPRRCR